MIQIEKMVQTCWACPSQWDGWDKKGSYYYFRYRHGYLRVEDNKHRILYRSCLGDDLDGLMEYEELKEHLRYVMSLPDDCSEKEPDYSIP